MGLFDRLKRNKQEEQKEQRKEQEEQEVHVYGWDAINRECERIYPEQKNPKHYGTLIKWSLGGKDPLDGISIYDGGDYWHFVTYGMSELYEKESENQEISGFGMEFTFKLKRKPMRTKRRSLPVSAESCRPWRELPSHRESFLGLMSMCTPGRLRELM